MRKRINRVALCSSENYVASRKAHVEMLKENRVTHSEYLTTVVRTVEVKHVQTDDLEMFEINLKMQIINFKNNKR